MFGNLLLAVAFQIGPFYEQRPDFAALRPLWSHEGPTTDVCWPVYAQHRDWWRFCLLTHYQWSLSDDSRQFEILPIWFNGTTRAGESYWGLFPLWGRHPHFLTMDDLRFCLWPLYTEYKTPRPTAEGRAWMTSHAVLFPFFSWRSDGSWGAWPIYGINHQRESDHHYALWPLATWADYREDRDTGGAGSSWMIWPLYARIRRERESQDLFLPPFFSYAETPDGWRLRAPWPLVEIERRKTKRRTSIFPLWEREEFFSYKEGAPQLATTRLGWRLVELYPNETRVFPFWKKNETHLRVWPFYEARTQADQTWRGVLALFPITWSDAVDRNWSKFWTFYESVENPIFTEHSLLWGIIRWKTYK